MSFVKGVDLVENFAREGRRIHLDVSQMDANYSACLAVCNYSCKTI